MKVQRLLLLLLASCLIWAANAEVTKGLKLPQLTTAQRDLIQKQGDPNNPYAEGQVIFNLDNNCLEYWNGTNWVSKCSCTAIATVGISPNTSQTKTLDCMGSLKLLTDASIEFTASAAEATSYEWYVDGAKQSETSATFTYTTPTSTGDHSVYAKAINDCSEENSEIVTVSINQDTPPTVSISSTETTVCVGTNLTMTATPEDGTWSSGTPATATIDATSGALYAVVAGTTDITYTYTDANGCTRTDTKTITVDGAACVASTFAPDPDKYVDIDVAVDASGNGSTSPTDTKTLRFLTYNLGADPSLSVKAQMEAFPMCPTDMTVYGGWYQWGRKNTDHTFRCDATPDIAGDDRFTTTLIPISNLASDDGKFVWGTDVDSNFGNWATPHVDNSNLWGNGLGIGSGGNTPVRGSDDPCPAGWRVPTQHEWALLGQEGGSANNDFSDDFVTSASTATLARSGLYWVNVVNGMASFSFIQDNNSMCGYALYNQADWDDPSAADYRNGTLPLYESGAPEPLLFLPAAGYRDYHDGERHYVGSNGYYWSSTVTGYTPYHPYYMCFSSSGVDAYYNYDGRAYAYSVRCVAECTPVTPSVSIDITSGSNPTCSGNAITFTATPTNGGTAPTYQWKVNGADQSGETAATFTYTTPANNAVVTCVMTSDDPCASVATATSGGVTVTVTAITNSTPTPATTTLCPDATQLLSSNNPGVGSYQWQSSPDNETWSDISGATAQNYTATAVSGTTIYYRRNVIATCGTVSSGAASVTGTNVPCDAGTFPIPATPVGVPITVDGIIDGGGNFVGPTSNTPTTTKTLTFMKHNLGANSALTVKQQMAYPGCPTDMTVFGGWYQWGRKNTDHTFRCNATPDVAGDSRFTTTLVPNTGIPNATVLSDPGQFVVTSSSPFNWTTPADNNSNLWGNGLAIGSGGNTPVKGLEDPCPSGWRVPTQHEWALLGWEDGSMTNVTGDENLISANVTQAPSGLYWVRVNNGAVGSFTSSGSNMGGWALYAADVWEAVYPTPPAAGTSLIDNAAPEPLLFLPAAGLRGSNNGAGTNVGTTGGYWSSMVSAVNSAFSCNMGFSSGGVYALNSNSRANGLSVRCVAECTPVTPSVSIDITSGSNPTCSGNAITFTATPTNGGTAPTYQWKVNGTDQSGETAATFTYTTPANNAVVTCVMTSDDPCASVPTATSEGVTVPFSSCVAGIFAPDPSKYVDIDVAVIYDGGIPVGPFDQPTTTTKTLRFLTYNLGADPSLSVKAQMEAFPMCPTDMTVYGGWYQWGRKNVDHTFRCDPIPNVATDTGRFTETLIPTSNLASDHGKFVWGTHSGSTGNFYNWATPSVFASDLWGNGGGMATQSNTTYSGSQNAENPCPAGWRVPTQHEWALLGDEDGDATTAEGDNFWMNGNATLALSGLYWVRVVNGLVASAFTNTDNQMCGYALYNKTDWEGAGAGYQDGTLPLYESGAPKPLLFVPLAGIRDQNGVRGSVGSSGNYWSSTNMIPPPGLEDQSDATSQRMAFSNLVSYFSLQSYRTYGCSVRCIAEE